MVKSSACTQRLQSASIEHKWVQSDACRHCSFHIECQEWQVTTWQMQVLIFIILPLTVKLYRHSTSNEPFPFKVLLTARSRTFCLMHVLVCIHVAQKLLRTQDRPLFQSYRLEGKRLTSKSLAGDKFELSSTLMMGSLFDKSKVHPNFRLVAPGGEWLMRSYHESYGSFIADA